MILHQQTLGLRLDITGQQQPVMPTDPQYTGTAVTVTVAAYLVAGREELEIDTVPAPGIHLMAVGDRCVERITASQFPGHAGNQPTGR